ncbi:bifunctional diguanylate cyclase/phosphodiesterase [Roseibium aquae]|nr:EAL domain-containing protein [Roseibium aquae]
MEDVRDGGQEHAGGNRGLANGRFSRRLDSVFRAWSANGRQIEKPLKVTFFTFLVVMAAVLIIQNLVTEYRNFQKPIAETAAVAEDLLRQQRLDAKVSLEHALAGILHNSALTAAIASQSRNALAEGLGPVAGELKARHGVAEIVVFDRQLTMLHSTSGPAAAAGPSTLLRLSSRVQRTASGVEYTGDGQLSIAVVRPWLADSQTVGYVQISKTLDKPLAVIGQVLDARVAMIHHLDRVPTGSQAALGSDGWTHAGAFAYQTEGLDGLPSSFAALLEEGLTGLSFLERLNFDDRQLTFAHGLTLPHADDEPAATVVVLQDVTSEFRSFVFRTATLIVTVAFLALIFWLIFSRLIRALQQSIVATRQKLEREVDANTKELEYSKDRLLEAQKIASVGSWERDLVTGEMHWSDEMYHIVGVPLDTECAAARQVLFRQIPPAERPMLEEAMDRAIKTCSDFDYEHQLIRRDGAVRHIHVRGYVLADDKGNATKIFGTSHDITDWHRARQQSQLLAGILEASMNEVYLFDASTFFFEYANTCGRENLGYTMEELMTRAPWDISPQHTESTFRQMLAPLLRGEVGVLNFESVQIRKDGTEYPVDVRLQLYRERNRDLFVAIASDQSERTAREHETRAAKEAAERIAYFDQLTGLANRAACQRDAERLFRPSNTAKPSFIIHMDLDNFKRINDTLGHPAGDYCLEEAGERLRRCCTEIGTAYRWGGDEFVILADGPDADPEELCERANLVMRAPMDFEGNQIWPSVSMGVARCPQDGTDFGTLLVHADLALYRSKDNGKDRWSYFTNDMKVDSDAEARIEKELREAIQRDEIFLVFQPQVNIRTQKVTGVEALVRWRHPTRGVLGPGAFLPVVEKTNLASIVGNIVIDKALQAARAWQDQGRDFGRVAVNLSPSHLFSGNLLNDFHVAMDKHGVEPSLITAEVLESVFLDDARSDNSKVLEELHSLGVHIELDDFGTGYASLSHVADLPINGLKIDRSFTNQVLEDVKKEIVVNQLINLARSLDIGVVCEGVETDAQFDRLRMMGDFSVQGYLIARPMPFEDMSEWLASSPEDLLFVI